MVVTHQAEKIWMYDRTTVHGATFNMSDQLYRGHANATALSSSPRVSAHRVVDFRLPHPILSAFKERNIADKRNKGVWW